MAITKEQFLKVMKFPKEWVEWGMWTDELSDIYVTTYEPEHEGATEHNLNATLVALASAVMRFTVASTIKLRAEPFHVLSWTCCPPQDSLPNLRYCSQAQPELLGYTTYRP
jgi:hypothetical protein